MNYDRTTIEKQIHEQFDTFITSSGLKNEFNSLLIIFFNYIDNNQELKNNYAEAYKHLCEGLNRFKESYNLDKIHLENLFKESREKLETELVYQKIIDLNSKGGLINHNGNLNINLILPFIKKNTLDNIEQDQKIKSVCNTIATKLRLLSNNTITIDKAKDGIKAEIGKLKKRIEEIENKKQECKNTVIKIIGQYINTTIEDAFVFQSKNEALEISLKSFSTEITLKCLYTLSNIDEFVNRYYNKNAEEISNIITNLWKNINQSFTETQLNALVNNSINNQRWNGHSLYPILSQIPQNISNLIKYQIISGYAKENAQTKKLPSRDDFISASDFFVMIRDFNSDEVKNDTEEAIKNAIKHSNDFDGLRYLNGFLNGIIANDHRTFDITFAIASYIVLIYEYDNYPKDNKDIQIPVEYEKIGLVYSHELNDLLNKNEEKKAMLNKLISNTGYIEIFNKLDSHKFYTLISKFNENEIKWLIEESKNNPNYNTFEDLLYYCIFFKSYVKNKELNYNNERYARINKLFAQIRDTDDISALGQNFAIWYNNIKLEDLTEEEFQELEEINVEFVINSLDYKNKIIYKKCQENNIKFKFYYARYIPTFEYLCSLPEIFENITNESKEKRTIPFYYYFFRTNQLQRAIELYKRSGGKNILKIPEPFFDKSESEIRRFTEFYKQYGVDNISKIPYHHFEKDPKRLQSIIKIYKERKMLEKIFGVEDIRQLPSYYTLVPHTEEEWIEIVELYKRYGGKNMLKIPEYLFFPKSIREEGIELYKQYGGKNMLKIPGYLFFPEFVRERGIELYRKYSVKDELHKTDYLQISDVFFEFRESEIRRVTEFYKQYGVDISKIPYHHFGEDPKRLQSIIKIYKEHGGKDILQIPNYYYRYYEEEIDILYKTITDIKANASMKLLSEEEILENYRIGHRYDESFEPGPHLLYKKPNELTELIYIWNSIPKQKNLQSKLPIELLMFDNQDIKLYSDSIKIIYKHCRNIDDVKQQMKEIKEDPELVERALKQNGLELENVSEELKKDINIVKVAYEQNPESFKYASLECQKELIKQNPKLIKYASLGALKELKKHISNNPTSSAVELENIISVIAEMEKRMLEEHSFESTHQTINAQYSKR